MHSTTNMPLSLGLLPEPRRNPASFVTSSILNGAILVLALVFGTFAQHEIQLRRIESTEIVFPTMPPPPVRVKVKIPPPPKPPEPPKLKLAKLESPIIKLPRIEPKPRPLPMIKEQTPLPRLETAKPAVALAPQPTVALAAAPALTPQSHPSVQPVHLGDMNGVRPNPDASRPATIAALGDPYGGSQGPSAAPRGVVGSAGFGNGTRPGSNAAGGAGGNGMGKVAAAGIPGTTAGSAMPSVTASPEKTTAPPVLLSHAEPMYTAEARQLKIEGDVVLRVTITSTGQMVVLNVLRGLGHGLDEAAIRSAPTYKFRPATENGRPVEYTTNIIIKFQTA